MINDEFKLAAIAIFAAAAALGGIRGVLVLFATALILALVGVTLDWFEEE